jgi:hypothetical protein
MRRAEGEHRDRPGVEEDRPEHARQPHQEDPQREDEHTERERQRQGLPPRALPRHEPCRDPQARGEARGREQGRLQPAPHEHEEQPVAKWIVFVRHDAQDADAQADDGRQTQRVGRRVLARQPSGAPRLPRRKWFRRARRIAREVIWNHRSVSLPDSPPAGERGPRTPRTGTKRISLKAGETNTHFKAGAAVARPRAGPSLARQ